MFRVFKFAATFFEMQYPMHQRTIPWTGPVKMTIENKRQVSYKTEKYSLQEAMFLQQYKIFFLTHVVFLFKSFSLPSLMLFWNTSSFSKGSISVIFIILKNCALFLINWLNVFEPFCRGYFPKSWPLVRNSSSECHKYSHTHSIFKFLAHHIPTPEGTRLSILTGWPVLGWGGRTPPRKN